jgi:hypothetical protein
MFTFTQFSKEFEVYVYIIINLVKDNTKYNNVSCSVTNKEIGYIVSKTSSL